MTLDTYQAREKLSFLQERTEILKRNAVGKATEKDFARLKELQIAIGLTQADLDTDVADHRRYAKAVADSGRGAEAKKQRRDLDQLSQQIAKLTNELAPLKDRETAL